MLGRVLLMVICAAFMTAGAAWAHAPPDNTNLYVITDNLDNAVGPAIDAQEGPSVDSTMAAADLAWNSHNPYQPNGAALLGHHGKNEVTPKDALAQVAEVAATASFLQWRTTTRNTAPHGTFNVYANAQAAGFGDAFARTPASWLTNPVS